MDEPFERRPKDGDTLSVPDLGQPPPRRSHPRIARRAFDCLGDAFGETSNGRLRDTHGCGQVFTRPAAYGVEEPLWEWVAAAVLEGGSHCSADVDGYTALGR